MPSFLRLNVTHYNIPSSTMSDYWKGAFYHVVKYFPCRITSFWYHQNCPIEDIISAMLKLLCILLFFIQVIPHMPCWQCFAFISYPNQIPNNNPRPHTLLLTNPDPKLTKCCQSKHQITFIQCTDGFNIQSRKWDIKQNRILKSIKSWAIQNW